MGHGTILFVHGTGVRLRTFKPSYRAAERLAAGSGVLGRFVPCAWGDALGAVFEGKSLPDGPGAAMIEKDAADLAAWEWLFDDPFRELAMLTIPGEGVERELLPPGEEPHWLTAWNRVAAYTPGPEFAALLERYGLAMAWQHAWDGIVENSPLAREAFETSALELPDAAHALARAIVAEMHRRIVAEGDPGPSGALRDTLVERLREDWGQQVLGPGRFVLNLLARAGTRVARHSRARLNEIAAFPIGDILLYQSHSEAVHRYLRKKIEDADPPVTLVAHSLGGIACFDLLALPDPPVVETLITAGSQAPLLYEMGALRSRLPGQGLPPGFPRWLNVFDRNDFLSFVAGRLFEGPIDREISSGQPFPDSHSAYFGNEAFWECVREFMAGRLR